MPMDTELTLTNNQTLSAHFEVGHADVCYESEAGKQFMSEDRGRAVIEATRSQAAEPESKKMGPLLRRSNIRLSHSDEGTAKSEQRTRFSAMAADCPASRASEASKQLRRSHIDLAGGRSRSGGDWVSVSTAALASNAEDKFQCSGPGNFDEIARELRRSNISLGARRWDFSTDKPQNPRSEQKDRFVPKPFTDVERLAEHLSKDLRASHIAVACGGPGAERTWVSETHSVIKQSGMSIATSKSAAQMKDMGKALRKSNISIGCDPPDYGRQTGRAPLTRRPPGLM